MLEEIGTQAYNKKDADLIDLCAAFLAEPSKDTALAILGNICSDLKYLECLEPPIEHWSEPALQAAQPAACEVG